LLHADAPILVCGELKKGSFWHGALNFQTGHFNLQSTVFVARSNGTGNTSNNPVEAMKTGG